jgi:iron complex transport system ATP-binding protein
MSVLELQGVSAQLGAREVLTAVDLEVMGGEVVGILGPNGAGKTTLLRAALGLIQMNRGVVRLGGDDLAGLGSVERARRAAYMPQSREIGWNMPALHIASLGAPLAPLIEARARAVRALADVGLDSLKDRGVLDLSGGERARVLLARLLVSGAPLLIADEPVAGLDPDAQLLAMDLLRAAARSGAGVLVTLHDLQLAARACDRLVVLNQGRVVASGAPAAALSPEVLRTVFRLDGGLTPGVNGATLSARRLGGLP